MVTPTGKQKSETGDSGDRIEDEVPSIGKIYSGGGWLALPDRLGGHRRRGLLPGRSSPGAERPGAGWPCCRARARFVRAVSICGWLRNATKPEPLGRGPLRRILSQLISTGTDALVMTVTNGR